MINSRLLALFTSLASLLLLSPAIQANPSVDVSTQLQGLYVTYQTETKSVRTLLYATNHEAYAVICDAEMKTNRDEKQKLVETRIESGTTITFTFNYIRSITGIHLSLMCVPTEEKAIVEAKGKAEGSNSEQSNDRIIIRKLAPPKEDTRPVIIPVEDLSHF
jgi:hypothetical protein